ncbi:zinc finger, CCHC-type containing protein [Tanacetum coccineum]
MPIGGKTMAEEDALPFDNFKGCVCPDYPDARVVGGRYSGSNQTQSKNVESAKELWDSLKTKYMAEYASSKKFFVSNFITYKMVDSRPVMEQFNKLFRILGQYTQHGLKMDESTTVSSVIDNHLRIKESLKAHESDKGKKRGFKDNNGGSGSNKKPKLECWKCGKTGHFKKDCHSGNKKNNASASGSGKGLMQLRDGLIMVPQLMFVKIVDGLRQMNRWKKDLAVIRLMDPKRKTLGEKGIDCIFVEYVKHFKAYRFYVIEPKDSVFINTFIESRDAIFNENRFSSIPRPKDIIQNLDESQKDDHLNDVKSETPEPHKGAFYGAFHMAFNGAFEGLSLGPSMGPSRRRPRVFEEKAKGFDKAFYRAFEEKARGLQ